MKLRARSHFVASGGTRGSKIHYAGTSNIRDGFSFFCTFGLVLVDTMNVEHKTFMTREKIGCFWVVQEIFFLPQKMIDAKV